MTDIPSENDVSPLDARGAELEYAMAQFMLQAARQGISAEDQDMLVGIAYQRAHGLAYDLIAMANATKH